MKLRFVSNDNIDEIKSNLNQWDSFFKDDSADNLEKELGRPLFSDTKFQEVPDFSLDMSAPIDKAYLTEGENAIRVYRSLMFLSDSQASDERLWAGLCLGTFWSYVKYRWNINEKCSHNAIRDHFFFGTGAGRRCLTRNAISRLWWIGRLTYDQAAEDPWELTRFVCENADFIQASLERNTSNNPLIMRPFLRATIQVRKDGIPVNTDMFGELAKYLNLLGGTYILDCLPEDRIYSKIYDKAIEMYAKDN